MVKLFKYSLSKHQLTFFQHTSPFVWFGTCFIITIGIGLADFKTGSEFAFSIFYLIPIILMTWSFGKKWGITLCIFSTVTWFIVDNLSGQPYSHPLIGYWNAVIRLIFFTSVALLISVLQKLNHEMEIARLDHLTNVANRRSFYELAETEINRSQRYNHPFTLVFMDLDGFKLINDQYGHQIGDKLLCTLVNQAKKQLRSNDIIARLGGDEFILLLPETGQDKARITVTKLQSSLLSEMRRHAWPVTFSIGVLTYLKGDISAEELVIRADQLMYTVKNTSKNAITYGIYAG